MAKAVIEPGESGNIIQIISAISQEAGVLQAKQAGGVPFAFRGIDATINHLAEHLDKYGVIYTARVVEKDTSFRAFVDKDGAPNGKGITQTDILVEYTFWAPDGSFLTTQAAGLAQDYADRSAAQAQSVALRVALLQLFHLPTNEKEPEAAGEDTQAKIAEHSTTRAAAVKAGPTAPAAVDYRSKIAELIGDESNTLDGEAANKAVAEAAGTSDTTKWKAEHFEAAFKALTSK